MQNLQLRCIILRLGIMAWRNIMAKVDPPPDSDELQKRQEPRWILDPNTVTAEEKQRLLRWARSKALPYEDRLSFDIPNGTIIADGDVEPEEPDIGSIYRFPDLHWIIFREGAIFSFQLFSRNTILLKIQFAKV